MISQEHHNEQIEACRAEFALLWNNQLMARTHSMVRHDTKPDTLTLVHDLTWQAYRIAKLGK